MYKALIIDDEKPVRIAISKLGHWRHYNIALPEMTAKHSHNSYIITKLPMFLNI